MIFMPPVIYDALTGCQACPYSLIKMGSVSSFIDKQMEPKQGSQTL